MMAMLRSKGDLVRKTNLKALHQKVRVQTINWISRTNQARNLARANQIQNNVFRFVGFFSNLRTKSKSPKQANPTTKSNGRPSSRFGGQEGQFERVQGGGCSNASGFDWVYPN
jgi:hypothetical protein